MLANIFIKREESIPSDIDSRHISDTVFPWREAKARGIEMEIVDVTDYGTAPEVYVDGIASIEFISRTIRINYYSEHGGGERRLILSLRWNLHMWLAACSLYDHAKNLGLIEARRAGGTEVCSAH